MNDIAAWANNDILDLWEKYSSIPECRIQEAPLLFHELKKDALLFVGINPSSSERGHRKIEKKSNRIAGHVKDLLPWKGRANVDVKSLADFERDAWEHYDYFARFREMAKNLNVPWTHVDLFFYRMKSQEDFKKLIYQKGQLREFAIAQLSLSLKIIEALEPKAIVVANSLACSILKERVPSLREDLDSSYGCHFYQNSRGQRVPTFFTSMLTGRRALDKGSFERLIWQIRRTLSR